MRMVLRDVLVAFALASTAVAPALAENPARQAVLDHFAAAAKSSEPAFAGFSAERGRAFFTADHGTGKPETRSCTSCHGADPAKAGRTRAGKQIDPMTVSANPKRYTDLATVEKWFGRNCASVLGRACSAREKGDFITFLAGQ